MSTIKQRCKSLFPKIHYACLFHDLKALKKALPTPSKIAANKIFYEPRLMQQHAGMSPLQLTLFLLNHTSENPQDPRLHSLLQLPRPSNKIIVKIMKYLIANGASIKNVDENSCTILHTAVDHTCHPAVEYLTALYTKEELSNMHGIEGHLPYHLALQNNDMTSVRILHQIGKIDLNATFRAPRYAKDGTPMYENIAENTGQTPIHLCCQYGNLGVLVHLLGLGVDLITPNWKARWGGTPLHVCGANNRPQCAEAILRCIQPCSKRTQMLQVLNFDQRTPIQVASHNGNANMVLVLEKGGFRQGDVVMVSGLITANEYNGKQAIIRTDFIKGRFGIVIKTKEQQEVKVVRVKPSNISLIDEMVPDPSKYAEDVIDGRFYLNANQMYFEVENSVLIGRLKSINYPMTGNETRAELQRMIKESGYIEHETNLKIKKKMKKMKKKKRKEAIKKMDENIAKNVNGTNENMKTALGHDTDIHAEFYRVRDACAKIFKSAYQKSSPGSLRNAYQKSLAVAKKSNYFNIVAERRKIRKSWAKKCAQCGTLDSKLKACQNCKSCFYCSSKHQKENWKKCHKKLCPQLANIHFDNFVQDMQGFIRGEYSFQVNIWHTPMWEISCWDDYFRKIYCSGNKRMPSTGTVLHFSGNKKTCFGKPLLSLDEMESINLKTTDTIIFGNFQGSSDDVCASERREETRARSYSHTIGGAIVTLNLRDIEGTDSTPFIIDICGASNWTELDLEVKSMTTFAISFGMMFPKHRTLYFRYIGSSLVNEKKYKLNVSSFVGTEIPKNPIFISKHQGVLSSKLMKENGGLSQLILMYHPGPNTTFQIQQQCVAVMTSALMNEIPLCVTEFCQMDLDKVIVVLKQQVIPRCTNKRCNWLTCGDNPWGSLKKKCTFSLDGIDSDNQSWLLLDPRDEK